MYRYVRIYMYIYIYTCVYMYIWIHTHTHTTCVVSRAGPNVDRGGRGARAQALNLLLEARNLMVTRQLTYPTFQ